MCCRRPASLPFHLRLELLSPQLRWDQLNTTLDHSKTSRPSLHQDPCLPNTVKHPEMGLMDNYDQSTCTCHRTSPLAIVSPMLSLRAPLRGLLAVLVPVCLFWISFACLTLCAEDCAEQQQTSYATYETLSVDTVRPSQDRDCCPITAAPPSVLPAHRITAPPGDHQQQVNQISTPPIVRTHLLGFGHAGTPGSKSDPPFERLLTLRI
jgi:hypothetical protein